MDLKSNLFYEHFFQFVITLVLVISYVITNINGKATSLLENVVLLAISFWFIASNNRVSTNQLDTKINAIASKVDTQESLKVKT